MKFLMKCEVSSCGRVQPGASAQPLARSEHHTASHAHAKGACPRVPAMFQRLTQNQVVGTRVGIVSC